ncbi:MAG TPA: hypothetical protein V6C65_04080 [Allocoleopsis sp.]
MKTEQLAEQNQIDEHDLTEALHYGTHNPSHGQQIGLTIIDDQSERDKQEWTIACVFELNGKRYGYYRDGAQTVLDELDDEKTVAEWAAKWDVEHIPDLLAATL